MDKHSFVQTLRIVQGPAEHGNAEREREQIINTRTWRTSVLTGNPSLCFPLEIINEAEQRY